MPHSLKLHTVALNSVANFTARIVIHYELLWIDSAATFLKMMCFKHACEKILHFSYTLLSEDLTPALSADLHQHLLR